MRPFLPYRGFAAPLPEADVNTDAIIPSEFLRAPDADLARGLFARRRFRPDGTEVPEFILNRAPFRRAETLVTGPNFGCGSSREAAVWALARFGIRCVAGPSFADIFHENALRNGLLVAVLAPGDAASLASTLAQTPDTAILDVDLASQTLRHARVGAFRFDVPAQRRDALLSGLDEIGETLGLADAISAHAAAAGAAKPWQDRAFVATESEACA